MFKSTDEMNQYSRFIHFNPIKRTPIQFNFIIQNAVSSILCTAQSTRTQLAHPFAGKQRLDDVWSIVDSLVRHLGTWNRYSVSIRFRHFCLYNVYMTFRFIKITFSLSRIYSDIWFCRWPQCIGSWHIRNRMRRLTFRYFTIFRKCHDRFTFHGRYECWACGAFVASLPSTVYHRFIAEWNSMEFSHYVNAERNQYWYPYKIMHVWNVSCRLMPIACYCCQ